MIGDGWDSGVSIRPENAPREPGARRRVAVVTGSRAEFGLLRPVMAGVARHPELELLVIAAGSHLISPALTFRDVKAEFTVADSIPMQVAGRTGRAEDADALGRGISRFTRSFVAHAPDWVVVLGDRIEAFAAAAAASVGGWAVAHLHGGDRAEGIADEAMRHAITKLAHLHLPATTQSAERIVRMGERPEGVIVVGSPAIDDLAAIPVMGDAAFIELGSPDTIVLFHPLGRSDEMEEAAATQLLAACAGRRTLALAPNHDAGRNGILRAIAPWHKQGGGHFVEHLPRAKFVALLKRLAKGGVLVGNSSAGLIEAAALKLAVVDVGHRQSGRERPANVVHAQGESARLVEAAIKAAVALDLSSLAHPYGPGDAGLRAASALASIDPREPRLLRKKSTY
ncbi:MAG: UDP-N-acetylglucosamine 2-epimerase [Planctomycetota bacterium]